MEEKGIIRSLNNDLLNRSQVSIKISATRQVRISLLGRGLR